MKLSRTHKKSLTYDIINQDIFEFACRVEKDPSYPYMDDPSYPYIGRDYEDEDSFQTNEASRSGQRVNVCLLDYVSKPKTTKRKMRFKKESSLGREIGAYEPIARSKSNQECSLDPNDAVSISEACFSRFENFPCGSKSIYCNEERVIFILIWTVSAKDLSFTLRATPVVNNSNYDNDTILSAVGQITKSLNLNIQREIQNVTVGGDIEDASIKCELIALYMNKIEKDVASMFSKSLNTAMRKGQVSPSRKLKSVLYKFDMIPGKSMDYFHLYSDTMQHELSNISRAEREVEINVDGHNEHCLICFDDLGGNGLNLSSCGHKACTSCWRDLIEVAASSGDAESCCPSFQCPNKIGIHDMIQIELGSKVGIEEARSIKDSSRIIANLVRFRIEKYILTNSSSKKARPGIQFCTTPSCNNVFSPRKINFDGIEDIDESSFDGSNIHFCKCGTSRCGDCNEDSHLGLSCEEYSKIKKELKTGRMDAEIKSLQWVKKNTSPCPRCNFPINKNGGCNHVRCSKCQYYFCWECGGDGQICGFYYCHNKKKDTEEETSSGKLSNHIDVLSEYPLARDRLSVSLRNMSIEENKFVALEVQLRQVLVWARLKLISSLLLENTKLINSLLGTIEIIELQLYVLEMRSLGKEKLVKRIVNQSLDQLSLTCIIEEQSNKFNNQYSLEDLITLSSLLSMSFERFSSYSASLIANIIETLRKEQLKKMKRQKIFNITPNYPLNEKAKPKRKNWTFEQIDLEEENEIEFEKKMRWKGKERLKARRSHALMIVNNL